MDPIPVGDHTVAMPEWGGSSDLPRLLARLLAVAHPLMGAGACSVALVEPGRVLRFVAASGTGATQILGQSIPTDRGVAGWAVTTGQAISVGDVETDARFARDFAESTGYLPRHITAVPITRDEATIGVVEVLDGDHALLSSASGSAGLHALVAAAADLVGSFAGTSTASPVHRAAVDALARLDDADPELAAQLSAVVQALAGGRGVRRR